LKACVQAAPINPLSVEQLSSEQRELLSLLVRRLEGITGIQAIVLAGSHARGRAHAGSDIDIGLFYSKPAPFSIEKIREVAESVNDVPGPVVTDFYGWGQWVNGGSWLTIGKQRVDLVYRCFEQVEQVISDAEAGRYELDYEQQPPFGFFSPTYLGEIDVCVPLFDPDGRVMLLKSRVAVYPKALRRSIVQDYLWAAEFGLTMFARKFAARSDTYGTAACLTRAVNQLVLVLFAWNRRYLLNDKTALAEIADFDSAPREFSSRVQRTLAHLGSTSVELFGAVESITRLLRETIDLTEGLYKPRFTLPT